jgi:nicotinate-nucleotide adenylyltransferase
MGSQTHTAFFGGSFDPPHLGHLMVASAALKSGFCEHVAWVPAFAPPHKNTRGASFADRAKMVELTIAGHDGMSISRIEEELHLTPSYTFVVLKAWESRYGEMPELLIGADSLLELHTWHRAAELAAVCRIITYPRDGAPVTEEALLRHWSPATAKRLLAGVIPGDFFEISSSELKSRMEKIADAGNIIHWEEYLVESVCDYIIRNGLYAVDASGANKS